MPRQTNDRNPDREGGATSRHTEDCAKIELMTLREQVEQYNEALKRFNEWEAQERPVERTPAAIIADIGAIVDWIPRVTRLADPDPQKLGVQRLFKALSLISPQTSPK